MCVYVSQYILMMVATVTYYICHKRIHLRIKTPKVKKIII